MLSLRSQVSLVAVILTGTGLLLFGSLLQIINAHLERSLLDTLVTEEARVYQTLLRPGEPAPALPQLAQTSAWVQSGARGATPEAFTRLPAGISHDVRHAEGRYHVLRQPLVQGELTVAIEISELKAKETRFRQQLLSTGLLILLLAGGAAYGLAGLATRPFDRLTRQIGDLEIRGQNLAVTDTAASREARVLSRALNRYLQQLQAAMTREQHFAAAASHEFRSPLTVLGGSLELIAADTTLTEPARRAVARAQRAQRELVETTEALLTLARDAPAPLVDGIDLVPVSRDYLEALHRHDPAAAARIQPRWPEEAVLQPLPESHWRIVLGNLLRNALQHAPTGPIQLRLDASGLQVDDEGPGVDESAVQALFAPGARSPSSAGAGLGLYIVAELARRHGWSVRVSNRLPQGLSLRIHFAAGASA